MARNPFVDYPYWTENKEIEMALNKRAGTTRCKNIQCDTDYDQRAYRRCPTCNWDNSPPLDKRPAELKEYERIVDQNNQVKKPAGGKEKMGFFSVWTAKKELELELRKLSEELDHHKRQEEMRIAEAVQKQRLISNEELSKISIEADQKVKKVQSDIEIDAVRVKNGYELKLSEMSLQHAKAIAEIETRLSKEYYAKLSDAMTELHQHGDKNSKFVQDLALEMVKKTPKMLPSSAEIHLSGDLKDLDMGA